VQSLIAQYIRYGIDVDISNSQIRLFRVSQIRYEYRRRCQTIWSPSMFKCSANHHPFESSQSCPWLTDNLLPSRKLEICPYQNTKSVVSVAKSVSNVQSQIFVHDRPGVVEVVKVRSVTVFRSRCRCTVRWQRAHQSLALSEIARVGNELRHQNVLVIKRSSMLELLQRAAD